MHAQLGKIAANTKTGKTEKVTPNDQCLAPISLPKLGPSLSLEDDQRPNFVLVPLRASVAP
jgi:hypothetical protein